MQQFCTYGSVRGASGNWRPYRDKTAPDGIRRASRRFSQRPYNASRMTPRRGNRPQTPFLPSQNATLPGLIQIELLGSSDSASAPGCRRLP
jgi:hypothetical protein